MALKNGGGSLFSLLSEKEHQEKQTEKREPSPLFVIEPLFP
jgi:hypothetical protein